MSQFHDDKLEYHRKIEILNRKVEEDQAKLDEACQKKPAKKSYHFGPANDLLRFFYILEKQNESDSDENRAKATEQLLNFIESCRVHDEPYEEEITATKADDQSTGIPQPPTPSSDPPVVITVPPVIVSRTRLSPVTDPRCITPTRLETYETLLATAHQYEQRYKLIDDVRKRQLAAHLREIINKVRTDTFVTLTDELFRYLNGEEQKVGTIMVRVNNHDERLLCLSMLANLILRQLLGSDLTDIKTDVFLPLITKCSANPQQPEFSTLFLDHLHKKCPYTVPFYPQRHPNMNDEQYLQAMGYIKKNEANQERLETDSEFFNRMSGFIRLFCKLLVSRGPPLDNSLAYAWTWFSDVLNLPQRPNITAMLIRVFLDEAGENMIKEYGQQFDKIIKAVHRNLPNMQKDTSADQIERLKITLAKFGY